MSEQVLNTYRNVLVWKVTKAKDTKREPFIYWPSKRGAIHIYILIKIGAIHIPGRAEKGAIRTAYPFYI